VNDERFVYVLLSTIHPNRYYTGLTSNVQARLSAHNAGLSKHTANGRPWKLVTTIEFLDAERARTFRDVLEIGFRARICATILSLRISPQSARRKTRVTFDARLTSFGMAPTLAL
jgi:hypothetical protein